MRHIRYSPTVLPLPQPVPRPALSPPAPARVAARETSRVEMFALVALLALFVISGAILGVALLFGRGVRH